MSSPKAPPLEARILRPPHKQTRFPAGAEAAHALIPSQSEKTQISNVVPESLHSSPGDTLGEGRKWSTLKDYTKEDMGLSFQQLEEWVGLNSQSPESGVEHKEGQGDSFRGNHASALLGGPQSTVAMYCLTGGRKFGETHIM